MVSALGVIAVVVWSGCATGLTGDPTAVSEQGATVSGSVVSDAGGQVEYWLEFGTTRAYGSESQHQTIGVAPNTPTPVSPFFDGGARATLYHYRLCARDGSQQGSPGCGEDRTVRTQSFACGETVTTSVRFTGDVSCQTENGLVIGAAGIVIDLNGFGLIGPVFVGGGSGSAIDNGAGFDGVTIRDGGVGNFGDGIHLRDTSANRVLHVSSFGPQDGIDIGGGDGNEVRHSRAGGRNNGLVVDDTTGLVVADSSADAAFGSGMLLSGLLDSRIVRNELLTPSGLCCFHFGIRVFGNRNVIMQNRASGWDAGNLVLAAGADNKLLDNEMLDAVLPAMDPGSSPSSGDGIFVGPFTAGTIVRGNHANGNDGDGIEVQGVETRITDNTANANADFGIDAVAGVTDGGGNSATGNGNPLQCRNVFCP